MRDGVAEAFQFLVGRLQFNRAAAQHTVEMLDFRAGLVAVGYIEHSGAAHEISAVLVDDACCADRGDKAAAVFAQYFKLNVINKAALFVGLKILDKNPPAFFGEHIEYRHFSD